MHREDRFIDCDWNGSSLTASIGFTGSVSGVHGRYKITWSNGCVFSPLGPLPKRPNTAASKTGQHTKPIAPTAPTRSDDPTTQTPTSYSSNEWTVKHPRTKAQQKGDSDECEVTPVVPQKEAGIVSSRLATAESLICESAGCDVEVTEVAACTSLATSLLCEVVAERRPTSGRRQTTSEMAMMTMLTSIKSILQEQNDRIASFEKQTATSH